MTSGITATGSPLPAQGQRRARSSNDKSDREVDKNVLGLAEIL